jgi:Flp pilus assembly protein TadG
MSRFQRTERFFAGRRGVAALEFALVAPFIISLMLVGTDLTIFMRTRMRLDETSTQLALVVTQYSNIYAGDFTGLFNAAQTVAGPTPVTGQFGTTIITGIVTDNNDRQTIAWQQRSSQATFNSLFGTAVGAVPTLPNTYLMPKNSTLIAVEVFTSASPWVLSASLMGGGGPTTSLRSYALFQPRLGTLSAITAGNRP